MFGVGPARVASRRWIVARRLHWSVVVIWVGPARVANEPDATGGPMSMVEAMPTMAA
jgi:hypothetical protein